MRNCICAEHQEGVALGREIRVEGRPGDSGCLHDVVDASTAVPTGHDEVTRGLEDAGRSSAGPASRAQGRAGGASV